MNFLKLVKKRHSVRAYKEKEVEKKKLDLILEAARLAPTASNSQPFKLIVAKTKGKENELKKVYDRDWFLGAPLTICICSISERAWKRKDGKNYYETDVAIVLDHLILAAADIGLGTCWIANFNEKEARKYYDVPVYAIPEIITPLGYPDDKPREKVRKSIEELVTFID